MTGSGFLDQDGHGKGGQVTGYALCSGTAYGQHMGSGYKRLELRDDTRLRRDLWDRCGDDTLRGLFLGQLRREYDGADPRRQKEIEQAVRFGLAALDNRD